MTPARLLSHITAIEALLEEKKQISELIRERKAHAKMDGFEVSEPSEGGCDVNFVMPRGGDT